jgi:phage terminase large subunit-like protein
MYAMISAHPWLAARTKVQHFHKQIFDLETGSMYAALSREAKTKMGLNPSFCCYDEYGQAPDDELYRAMDSAMGARESPLLMCISTQAADDTAPLSRLIDYGLRVRAKEIRDPSFHLALYCAAPDDDPWDVKTWRKANPALNDFRSLQDVRRLAAQAQRLPGQENSFRNLILNQRVAAHTPFIEPAVWKACGDAADLQPGAAVYAALDLGSTRDMSALVLIAESLDGVFHVEPFYWLPGNVEQRESEDRAPYREWAHEGYLEPIGEATDPRVIALRIAELNGQYGIRALAYDRWRIGDLKRELDAIGCTVQLVPHGQGFRDMSPAVDILERLIVQRRIRHGNHPVLTMNAAAAIVTRDAAGGRKLDKAKSKGRIDGLVALAMAFNIALAKQVAPVIDVNALIG